MEISNESRDKSRNEDMADRVAEHGVEVKNAETVIMITVI